MSSVQLISYTMSVVEGGSQMAFHDVVILPSLASFYTKFLNNVIEAKVMRLLHVFMLWLGLSKGTCSLQYAVGVS